MLYVSGETLYMPDTLIKGDPDQKEPSVGISPFIVGGVILAALILLRKKKTRKNPFPLFLLPGV